GILPVGSRGRLCRAPTAARPCRRWTRNRWRCTPRRRRSPAPGAGGGSLPGRGGHSSPRAGWIHSGAGWVRPRPPSLPVRSELADGVVDGVDAGLDLRSGGVIARVAVGVDQAAELVEIIGRFLQRL